MKLIDYILGNRKGKQAHQIERDAMRDPFLRDAIEGFDNVEHEDHAKRLKRMQEKIRKRPASTDELRRRVMKLSVAASVICLITAGGFVGVDLHRKAVLADQNRLASLELMQLTYHAEGEAIIYMPAASGNRDEFSDVTAPTTRSLIIDSDTHHVAEMSAAADLAQKSTQVERVEEMSAKISAVETELQETVVVGYGVAKKKAEAPSATRISEISKTEQKATRTSKPEYASSAKDVRNELFFDTNPEQLSESKSKEVAQEPGRSGVKFDAENQAIPIRGVEAYGKYIAKNIRRPIDDNVTGMVVLEFDVDTKGAPCNIRVLRSLGQRCDEEVIRLLENGGKWKPRNTKSIRIIVRF